MATLEQSRRPHDLSLPPIAVPLAKRPFDLIARFVIGLLMGLLAGILAGEPVLAAGRATDHAEWPSKYIVDVAPPGLPPTRLYAEELGVGPPVVLLHGLGGSGYTWRYMVDGLARHHRVIAIDLKGFGRSEKPYDQHYSALDQAAYVRSFLDQRGLRDITLVGHSFGGAVAMVLALDLNRVQPDRIGRLVLMDTPAYPQELSPTVRLLRKPVLPILALSILPPIVVAQLSLINDDGAFAHLTPNDVSMYAAHW
jgi:pimeloyl-ACP methyl ester carboxylesterase